MAKSRIQYCWRVNRAISEGRSLLSFSPKFVFASAILALGCTAMAQQGPSANSRPDDLPDAPIPSIQGSAPAPASDANTIVRLPGHILGDEKAILVSPLKLRTNDLKWLVPLAGATAAAFATDHYTMNTVITKDGPWNQANINTSNVLIGGLVGVPLGMYVYGRFGGHEYERETGMLVAEAGADAVITEQVIKLVTWRERPYQDNSRGLFYQGSAGFNSSFPSSHIVVAWSAASVLANRYPSKWMALGVYSAATAVSLTRVLGQQHFPSDVLIGSASGWLIGHYVARVHRHIDRN